MKDNDTGRDEKSWYLLGENRRISPRQGDLEEPH